MNFRRYLLVTVLLLVFAAGLSGVGENVVTDIRIEGNQNIDPELIFSVVTLKYGDFLTADEVANSIKNLYQLGVFNNIVMEAEELDSGVGIVIRVEEYPIVDEVEYEGYDELDEDDFEEVVSLRKGSYWSPYLVSETRQKIMDEYQEKGYHFAQITFKAESLDNNRVKVTVMIDEGAEIRIKKIHFHGNKEIPSGRLRYEMSDTKQKSLFYSGKFDQQKFEADLDKIINFYSIRGYIDARIISWETNILEEEYMYIDIFLYEGEEFMFGDVTVDGNERFTSDVLVGQFDFYEDEVFDREYYEEQLMNLSTLYYEEGYIYAQFDETLEKRGNYVDIHVKIQENTRARIHKIKITGNRTTKEKIIRRQLAISPGDYFQRSKLIQSQRNIYNLGFFEPDMYPDWRQINENGDIDLILHLNDKHSGTANGGVGYNSTDKFVGQLAVSHNNLFGNAWRASFQYEFGKYTQDFELDLSDPYLFDSYYSGGMSLYRTEKDYTSSNFNVETNGGSLRVGHHVAFLDFAKVTLGYALSSKKYQILDRDDSYSTTIRNLEEKGWQYNSNIYLTFSRDSRDNVFFPTTGTQFTIYQELAGGPFQGDFDYYKNILEFRYYIKTFWEFVLRTKVRMGYVTEYGRSDEVPPEERFYLGGTGSDGIRGYSDRSIGPTDGGHREMIFSTEYAFPLAGDEIIGLFFFDAGDSYNEIDEFNFWNMKKGGGIGLRLRSPLGLIGFDYAYNFDRDDWEPHFQLGYTF